MWYSFSASTEASAPVVLSYYQPCGTCTANCLNGVYKCRNSHTALFSSDCLSKDLPVRLSALLQLPVSADDGHSPQCCRPCMRKFFAAESFVSMATNSYQKKTIDGDESSPVEGEG